MEIQNKIVNPVKSVNLASLIICTICFLRENINKNFDCEETKTGDNKRKKVFNYLFHFQWPYCDGAHGPHNKATGDNTGPVVVRHKENK